MPKLPRQQAQEILEDASKATVVSALVAIGWALLEVANAIRAAGSAGQSPEFPP